MAPTFVRLVKQATTSPADTSALRALKLDPATIVAVVGKSEGNGCVNDHSRTLSALVWEALIPPSAIAIFSGGTEGILTPHVTLVVKERINTGLIAAVGRTRILLPEEVGKVAQAEEVSAAVKRIMSENSMEPGHVQLVLVKCPLLDSSKIAAIQSANKVPCSLDTYTSMAKSRYATAVGIAEALGEIDGADVVSGLEKENVWSARASCSSGAELEDCHIMILANAPESLGAPASPSLHAVAGHMKDAIDAAAVLRILEEVKAKNGKVVQVFVKAEASPSGTIRGLRHTMNTDSDIHSTRHARGAVGGLCAGLTGDTMLYVSGGAEGQGQPGGGSLCIVYEAA